MTARSGPGSSRACNAWLPWVVALLALLPHLRGLSNDFVYDDFRFVVENPGVHSLERPWELVASVERASAPADRDVWRPLRTVAFALEHAAFARLARPAIGFHLVSLLLALLLVRATIELVRRLPGVPLRGALAAGLLFGVHPLTVESVAWISSQCDLLAAIGVVAALVLARERPWLALAASVFALLAKESALTLALLLLLARLGLFGETLRARTSVVVGAAVATLLDFVARQSVLAHGFSFGASGLSQVDATCAERVLQAGQSVVVALERFVWPAPLSIDYTQDPTSLGAPRAWQVGVALVLFGVAAWFVATRRARPRANLGLALFFLGLAPTCGLVVAMKSATAERFMLVPTLGLVVALVALAASIGNASSWAKQRNDAMRAPPSLVALAALVAIAWSLVTWRRTGDFRDGEALWSAELRVHPESVQAQLGLAQVASERGDLAEVERRGAAIVAATQPGRALRLDAMFGLGKLEIDAGRDAEGATWMERVREEIAARGGVADLDPQLHLAYVALGNFLRTARGADVAEAALREGIAWFGRRARLLEGLGVVRDMQHDAAGAEALCREALRASDPDGESPSLRHHLAIALSHLGRQAEADALSR